MLAADGIGSKEPTHKVVISYSVAVPGILA